MVGKPTFFKDGVATLITFSSFNIPRPLQLSIYRQQVNPIIDLPGGAYFDTWEASDLPTPRLMPVVVPVLLTATNWNATIKTWQGYQGRNGRLWATSIDGLTNETADCYLSTVNVKEEWVSGCIAELEFTFTEDWS